MKRGFYCPPLQHVYFKCPQGTHCLEQTAPPHSLEERGMNRKTAQECKCVLDKKLKGKILRVEVAIVLFMIWKCLHWETRHQKLIPREKLCCAQNSHLRLQNDYSCWMIVSILFDAVASAATCSFTWKPHPKGYPAPPGTLSIRNGSLPHQKVPLLLDA